MGWRGSQKLPTAQSGYSTEVPYVSLTPVAHFGSLSLQLTGMKDPSDAQARAPPHPLSGEAVLPLQDVKEGTEG